MRQSYYEAHSYADPDFPIIFNPVTVQGGIINDSCEFVTHWHEGIEVLCCTSGSSRVFCNENGYHMDPGEAVVVNSDFLHTVENLGDCRYYYLIAEMELFSGLGFPVREVLLKEHVQDEYVRQCFENMAREMREQSPYYKAAMRGLVICLFSHLYRNYTAGPQPFMPPRQNNRLLLVREGIGYIRQNYQRDLTIEEICAHLGFSKYYFCHVFKELTGRTVIDYINYLRCSNARSLLATGKYNISESAGQSGFKNLSYFTRVYKRQMGELPSESSRPLQ